MALKRNRLAWSDDLSRVRWHQFEHLLADHYRDAGYDVEHCGTAATGSRYDGGVDLVLRRDGETTLVQCKHWNSMQVAHNDVHQLLGLLETRGAQKAILVTSGEFTSAAWDAARRAPRITLVDGSELRRMIDPRLIPAPVAEEPASAVSHSDLMAWQPVVEKTVDVIDVMSGRRPGRRRRTIGEEVTSGLLKLALFVVMAFVVMTFMRHQVEKVTASLAPSPRPDRAATAPAAVPPSTHPQSPAANTMPPPPANGIQRMTEEELAEWERKNRESMEILERTTPELKH